MTFLEPCLPRLATVSSGLGRHWRLLHRAGAVCAVGLVGELPSTGRAPLTSQAPVLRAEREVSVPILNSDGVGLPVVGDLVVGADGLVFVALPSVPAIAVFDSAGRRRTTLGRKGAGPGEFADIHSLYRLADSLVVVDPMLNRFTIIGDPARGRITRTVSMQRGLMALLQRGRAIAETHPRGDSASRWPLYLSTWEGKLLDTIMLRPLPRGSGITIPLPGPRQRTLTLKAPEAAAFDDGPFWRVSPGGGGLLLVERPAPRNRMGTEFRAALLGLDLDTMQFIRQRAPSQQVDERDLAVVVTELAARARAVVPSVDAEGLIRDALKRPFYAPVSDAFVGEDGTIWVATPVGSSTTEWLVLDRGAKPIGRVRLSSTVHLRAGTGARVWGIANSADGESSLVRFSIRR